MPRVGWLDGRNLLPPAPLSASDHPACGLVYLRFTLGQQFLDVAIAQRGLDISYETARCWVLKFGPVIARRLRRCRPRPSNRWHLDEMVVRIAGQWRYLWINIVVGPPITRTAIAVDYYCIVQCLRAIGDQTQRLCQLFD